MSDELDKTPENTEIISGEISAPETDGKAAVRKNTDANAYFRAMMDRYFLDYAAYVIKDRAIPDVDDGLKPVQRRILWVLHEVDDGRTHKAANIVGNTMHYHPHGDASIGDAMVVLANKEYFITKQGNFGNIFTGSPAAAPRYIECSLSPLGREVLFSDEITELVDSYDGRSKEPVVLPVKIPSLLMLGSDGIAVGMATKIMPHNFNELLQAQIAALRGEPFELYPDFLQGGLMDAREYADGNGKIVLRAKIEIDGRELVIREIPATTTTESLVASIEKAAEKNKIRVSSINDYTAENVEIRVVPMRGADPEKTLQALYMYTDCAVSISVNMTVICDRKPTQMTVHDVIIRNTEKLLEYLNLELENEYNRQSELFHAKTLAQLFFEHRIYKRIEECRSEEEEYAEVHAGLAPYRPLLKRDVTDEDIDKLLALPVRRISRFDIEKNQRELRKILDTMKQLRRNLSHLNDYAIEYLQKLLEKYGKNYPRRTEIEHFDKIDRQQAALSNIKVGWDRKNGYIGTKVKSDDTVLCNEFDRLLCVTKQGKYKVIAIPEKDFVGKLYDFRRYDTELCYGIIYREKKSGKYYGKRSIIGGFILDREYQLCPEGCQLELLTPRADAVYTIVETDGRGHVSEREINLMELPLRVPKARGFLISSKTVNKITHSRYLTEEELATLTPVEDTSDEEEETTDVAEVEEAVEETVDKIAPVRLRIKRNPLPELPVLIEPGMIPDAAVVPAAEEKTAEETPVVEETPVEAEETPVVEETPVAEEIPVEAEETEAEETAESDSGDDTQGTSGDGTFFGEDTEKPAKEDKPRRSRNRKHDYDDDDFGIIQPEFGF